MVKKSKALKNLPVFNCFPFDGKSDIPVIHRAIITMERTPATDYFLEKMTYVVGKSSKEDVIYFSTDAMKKDDGKIFAVHGDCAGLEKTSKIIDYKIDP